MVNQVMRRKLHVLQCPFLDSKAQIQGELEMQRLVNWLEDSHIRRYTPAERAPLRRRDFRSALTAYCRALGLPLSAAASATAALPYLLDIALGLHYEDCADIYNTPVDLWSGRAVPVIQGAAKDPAVMERTRELLKALGVELPAEADKLDAADLMDIVAEVVEAGDNGETEDNVDLAKLPLGFKTGDEQVDRVAAVLRLLHVRDLHRLQNAINDAVADMQALTADPKTDSRLGRVGR